MRSSLVKLGQQPSESRSHIPSPWLTPFLGRWAWYCGVKSQVPLTPGSPRPFVEFKGPSSLVASSWLPCQRQKQVLVKKGQPLALCSFGRHRSCLSASKIHGAHILQFRRKFLIIPLTATNFITHDSGKLNPSRPLETFQPVSRYPAIPAVVLEKKYHHTVVLGHPSSFRTPHSGFHST